ncbi:Alpha-methylacyl-CoA racemase [Armadillidium vulgare]|nr:Alpha-methylacyl-CoA racemase [Armadillidium vulgare]
MCQTYDVLIDPFRPGVLEKMKLGPKDLMDENPQLIYARLSGFGQSGPLAKAPGHDINYVALSGILSTLGRKETVPTPPVNLLADFAGGGLLCALGIVLSLYDRLQTGKGQVVDLGMSEGAAYVGSFLYSTKNSYLWGKPRGENWLDSGAHFYDTYETKDGQYMSVGAIEPQFYSELLKGLELSENDVQHLSDFSKNKDILKEKFKEKTRDEWSKRHACSCSLSRRAPNHPHNLARKNFRKVDNRLEPCVAPRLTDPNGLMNPVLEETQGDLPSISEPGEDTHDILKELGYSESQINELVMRRHCRFTVKALMMAILIIYKTDVNVIRKFFKHCEKLMRKMIKKIDKEVKNDKEKRIHKKPILPFPTQ